jgi:hypothetical protein
MFSFGKPLRKIRNLPTFSPIEKHMKINRYQHTRIENEVKSSRAGCSKPFLKTPKLGNSHAVKLTSTAAIETREGLRKELEGMANFMGS